MRLLNDWIDGMTIEEMTPPPERKGASAAVKVPVELLMQAENRAAKRRKDPRPRPGELGEHPEGPRDRRPGGG